MFFVIAARAPRLRTGNQAKILRLGSTKTMHEKIITISIKLAGNSLSDAG